MTTSRNDTVSFDSSDLTHVRDNDEKKSIPESRLLVPLPLRKKRRGRKRAHITGLDVQLSDYLTPARAHRRKFVLVCARRGDDDLHVMYLWEKLHAGPSGFNLPPYAFPVLDTDTPYYIYQCGPCFVRYFIFVGRHYYGGP